MTRYRSESLLTCVLWNYGVHPNLYGDWSAEPEIEGQIPRPSDQTLEILKRRGYLTEMSPQEEEEKFEAFATDLHERNIRQMSNYMFMPAYNHGACGRG